MKGNRSRGEKRVQDGVEGKEQALPQGLLDKQSAPRAETESGEPSKRRCASAPYIFV